MQSWLIKPLQRLCKYPLLLRVCKPRNPNLDGLGYATATRDVTSKRGDIRYQAHEFLKYPA